MKRPYYKALSVLVILIAAGLIFTSIQSSRKYKFDRRAEELHQQLIEATHYVDPSTAMEIISNQDDNYIFVDIRNPRDFANFHIEGAVNVPIPRILDDVYIPYLESDRKKILYSDESIEADQIRLLLTQYGYDNLYVLQGGATYWKENVLSKNVFRSTGEYEDEKLNFDIEKIKNPE